MKKAWGLNGLHDEREKREKGEHKLGRDFRSKILGEILGKILGEILGAYK